MEMRGVVVVEDARHGVRSAGSAPCSALEPVANRPIVDHVLDVLESAGVKEIIVISSERMTLDLRERLAARRLQSGRALRHIEHSAPVDVGEALRLAAPIVGSAPCIVHLANGLLGEPLAPCLDRLTAEDRDAVLFVHQGPGSDEHLSSATQEMLHLAELRPERASLCMAGVWLFGAGVLQRASKRWRPGDVLDPTVVAGSIAGEGGTLDVRLVDTWRRYTGDPTDLLELNRIALDWLVSELQRPGNHGNQIEGRVRIHERASVRASVIVGPVVIGPDAYIADAYIGPYTSIGEGARIEGAEVERSIVCAGASIMHVGGRLMASVVGRDARVFRDFSLPRALRLRVGDGTEVALN
jgi:glucose-1-phosphate thymidylyltransferase